MAPGTPLRRAEGGGSSLLTRRERDVLVLLASGVDLQRAAARLEITVNTARGYVKNLYRKLGVHNQLELVAVARARRPARDDTMRPLAGTPVRPRHAPPPPFPLAWTGSGDDGARVRVRTG